MSIRSSSILLSNRSVFKRANAQEHQMHLRAASVFRNHATISVPPVFQYIDHVMQMHRVPHMTVADMYGERWEDVPSHIRALIVVAVTTLFQCGVVYPDITGYNFIYYKRQLWMLDFGHSFEMPPRTEDEQEHYTFVHAFVNDASHRWNAYFK